MVDNTHRSSFTQLLVALIHTKETGPAGFTTSPLPKPHKSPYHHIWYILFPQRLLFLPTTFFSFASSRRRELFSVWLRVGSFNPLVAASRTTSGRLGSACTQNGRTRGLAARLTCNSAPRKIERSLDGEIRPIFALNGPRRLVSGCAWSRCQ